ncbi:MAG: NUDIX domain-containing protein, partial [Deltaproteobacteria bacterium]|nr:NUDIX domain-containing protein [Deltaproteobacteria bacterium]
RTAREEVGIRIKVKEDITAVNHAYTHFRITLYAFRCVRQGGAPAAMNCTSWKWIKPRGLRNYPFSKADRKIIKTIPDLYSVT